MKAPFTCPANAHRLFDLISVDDAKFLPAFYFALSDTLVTSSLDIVRLLGGVRHRRASWRTRRTTCCIAW